MLFQRGIQDGPDPAGVAQRGHSTHFLTRVLQHECRLGAPDPAGPKLICHECGVNLGSAAGKDQQRFAIDIEYQAVGNSCHLAAKDRRCSCGRRHLVIEYLDCVLGAAWLSGPTARCPRDQ